MRWLKAIHSFGGKQFHQVPLDLDGVFFPRQAQAAADPRHVSVHHDAGGDSKGRAQDHVGRFPSHAG